MWLKVLAVAVVAGIAAVSGLSLGSGDDGSGSPKAASPIALKVTPARGHPRTAFTFTFTAPQATGAKGHTSTGYSLSVSGPKSQQGCLSSSSAVAAPATKGTPVTVTLDPARLARIWCHGTYTARGAGTPR